MRAGTSTVLKFLAPPLTGVSQLDLALAHKPHTTTESVHALSARVPQSPLTLDPTGCSCVVVHEFHRH